MPKVVTALPLLLALLLAVGHTAWAETQTTCTYYCHAIEPDAGNSGHICYLTGGNGMPSTLAQHCLNQPEAQLPIPLTEDLQQRLLTGNVTNTFRQHYPLPAGVPAIHFDATTVARLQALPLQLDEHDNTEEWLVYDSSPAAATPPHFWVIQYQGQGIYRIVLEHAGQMLWVTPERADGYFNLRTARFAELDADSKSGSFTDYREWQYTNGVYSLLKASGMAAGSIANPEPL